MKIGLVGINMGPCSTPGAVARVAQAAEAAGFESLWAGEHVVLPEPQVPPSPIPPTFPMLDPTVAFAFTAGQTAPLLTAIAALPESRWQNLPEYALANARGYCICRHCGITHDVTESFSSAESYSVVETRSTGATHEQP